MAIHINNANANKIINALINGIDKKQIHTWEYTIVDNDDGDEEVYFIHSTNEEQWDDYYFFNNEIQDEYIVFSLYNESHKIEPSKSAILHGRFVSLILEHCKGLFHSLCLP